MRGFLIFILVLAILVVGTVLLAPMFISSDVVKREVESAVETATGRKLTIAGDVKITAWPALGAELQKLIADGTVNAIYERETGMPFSAVQARAGQTLLD